MIQPCYDKGERGNKLYLLETMLRLYLLQNLFELSDEATAAEAIDSRAFSENAIPKARKAKNQIQYHVRISESASG